MKRSPEKKKLEEILRSSKLVAGGFLGSDNRDLDEIIACDAVQISRLGYTKEQIAGRMREITAAGVARLGMAVVVEGKIEVKVDEWKGMIVCPWPHQGRYAKRITIARDVKSGRIIRWSDLNTHMIGQHGFFEGKGSLFRLEPGKLVEIIFCND
ncbi:MAG: hypothetical protein ABIG61_08835 [Planctomycetota bacterium]